MLSRLRFPGFINAPNKMRRIRGRQSEMIIAFIVLIMVCIEAAGERRSFT